MTLIVSLSFNSFLLWSLFFTICLLQVQFSFYLLTSRGVVWFLLSMGVQCRLFLHSDTAWFHMRTSQYHSSISPATLCCFAIHFTFIYPANFICISIISVYIFWQGSGFHQLSSSFCLKNYPQYFRTAILPVQLLRWSFYICFWKIFSVSIDWLIKTLFFGTNVLHSK